LSTLNRKNGCGNRQAFTSAAKRNVPNLFKDARIEGMALADRAGPMFLEVALSLIWDEAACQQIYHQPKHDAHAPQRTSDLGSGTTRVSTKKHRREQIVLPARPKIAYRFWPRLVLTCHDFTAVL
jgi:hypothetical protein